MYLLDHPGVTVVIHHSVIKVKHHQSLHVSPRERKNSGKQVSFIHLGTEQRQNESVIII